MISAVTEAGAAPRAGASPSPSLAPLRSRVAGWAGCRTVTLTAVAIMVAVWCLEQAFIGHTRGGRTIGYLAFGGLPNATVSGRGSPEQWWRYISDGLVHDTGTILHLGVNAGVLLLFGGRVERLYGRRGCLAALVVASVAGGVGWMVWSALGFVGLPDYSIGASTAACGLIGLLLAYAWGQRPGIDPHTLHTIKAQAVLGIALLVLLGLVVPGLNNAAHAGGLVGGAIVGLRLPPRPGAGGRPLRRAENAALWAVVALTGLSLVLAGLNLESRILGS